MTVYVSIRKSDLFCRVHATLLVALLVRPSVTQCENITKGDETCIIAPAYSYGIDAVVFTTLSLYSSYCLIDYQSL